MDDEEMLLLTRDFVSEYPEMVGVEIMLNNGTEYPILKIVVPYVAIFLMFRNFRSVFDELASLCGEEDSPATQKRIIEIAQGVNLPLEKEEDDQSTEFVTKDADSAEFVTMIKDIVISGLRNGNFEHPASIQDREKLTILAQDLVLVLPEA